MTIRIEGLKLDSIIPTETAIWQEGTTVVLQDGQTIHIVPGQTLHLPSVHGSDAFNVRLDFLAAPTPLNKMTLSMITTLLQTYSTSYARVICFVVGNAFRDGVFDDSSEITLPQLDTWVKLNHLSYWPFLKFYLFQLSLVRSQTFISEDIRHFLAEPENFEDEGNGVYFSLLTNDPERGALTEQELRSIQSGLNLSYVNNRLSFFEYVFTWFLVATGVRPIQMARMTFNDIIIEDGPAGKGREVTLMIPAAKGTQATTLEYIPRRAPSVLADILIRYLKTVGTADPRKFLFFDQAKQLNGALNRVFTKIDTYSERTGNPIHITPYRFRYTLGTRAIAQGATDAQVARLLTHRSLTCIKYYRAAMAMHQAPIEDAIGEEMDFFAGVFGGRIINDFSEATHSNNYNKLIRDFERLLGKKIGACGTSTECHQNAPRACLSCWLFEPLLEAPWDLLVNSIQADIDRETEPRIKQIAVDEMNGLKRIQAACEAKKREMSEYAQ